MNPVVQQAMTTQTENAVKYLINIYLLNEATLIFTVTTTRLLII